MTIVAALARLARGPADAASLDYLRALCATNIAAGQGYLGSGERIIAALPVDETTGPGAAYRFGVQLHARTQDDFHPAGRVHVGAVTLAAALALADHAGDRTLQCLAGGYEVMCAIAIVYAPDAQKKGFRPTGLFGPIAAAATAGLCLNLSEADLANALALAAARSGGTNQSWLSGTDEWLLEGGNAARAGVEAALLSQAGVAGAAEAIEGEAGWSRAFFDDLGATRLAETLEAPSSRIGEVAAKPYPVSGIAQVATELSSRAWAELDGATPDAIIVSVSSGEAAYPGSANKGPFRSRSDALMSIAFCVAAAAKDGRVTLSRIEAPNDLHELTARVRVTPDPALEEGKAALEVFAGERVLRLEGSAADMLHPVWCDLRRDAVGLAGRSEASLPSVESAIAELSADRVDALGLYQSLVLPS